MREIDLRRPASMALATIGSARFATRAVRIGFRQATRKRRRLPIRRTAGSFEVLFQPLVLASQTIAFGFRPLQILTQSFNFPRLILDDLLRVTGGTIWRAPRHAPVIADSDAKYKDKMPAARC